MSNKTNTIKTPLLKARKTDFLKLIEIIPDAIVVVNNHGIIEYINSHTTEIFGYGNSELIGKTIEILMPRRFKERHIKHREGYNKMPVKRPMGSSLELLGQKNDGKEFPVDIMLSPIEVDSEQFVISVIRDITLLKKREKAIEKQSKQVEDMVNALTHDLKTPLIAAETNYKLLMEQYFGKLTKEQEQIITLLTKSNRDALRLVKNLLDVFKFETKSYRLLVEVVELHDLLHRAIETVKPMLKEKNINLKLPSINFNFECDSFELERVLVNLLTNSIHFIDNAGSIEIDAMKKDNGNILISVEDSGKGIAQQEMDKLFERFWHSKRSNTSSHSTGLGLYLCKQIINTHKGKIWVESKEGKGTKVTFEFPSIVTN